MWFGARWLCSRSFTTRESTQLEKDFSELLGMSSSYATDKKKLSRWPDLGLLYKTRVCPGKERRAETGSAAGEYVPKLQRRFSDLSLGLGKLSFPAARLHPVVACVVSDGTSMSRAILGLPGAARLLL